MDLRISQKNHLSQAKALKAFIKRTFSTLKLMILRISFLKCTFFKLFPKKFTQKCFILTFDVKEFSNRMSNFSCSTVMTCVQNIPLCVGQIVAICNRSQRQTAEDLKLHFHGFVRSERLPKSCNSFERTRTVHLH